MKKPLAGLVVIALITSALAHNPGTCTNLLDKALNVEVALHELSPDQHLTLKGAAVEVHTNYRNEFDEINTIAAAGIVQSAHISSDTPPIIYLRVYTANEQNKLVNFAYHKNGNPVIVKVAGLPHALFDFRDKARHDGLTVRELRHNEPQVRFSKELEKLPKNLVLQVMYLTTDAGRAVTKTESLQVHKLPKTDDFLARAEEGVDLKFKNADGGIVTLKIKDILALAYRSAP